MPITRLCRDETCPNCGHFETYTEVDFEAPLPTPEDIVIGCSSCGHRFAYVSIALYNEGSPNAGYDWVAGGGPHWIAELAENYVTANCLSELPSGAVHTVRMFSMWAPIFDDDECNELLVAWLDDHILKESGADAP